MRRRAGDARLVGLELFFRILGAAAFFGIAFAGEVDHVSYSANPCFF
jgi:hypothetical protein